MLKYKICLWYTAPMLLSGLPFSEVWKRINRESFWSAAAIQFVEFLEHRFGGRFLYDEARIPFGRLELVDLFELGAKLRSAGIIHNISPTMAPPDEPPFFQWHVECATADKHTAGGMALLSDRDALLPALAEAVERFLWITQTDFFISPHTDTAAGIETRGAAILPQRFVGWSEHQRREDPRLILRPEAQYLWIQGHSHIKRADVWVPAQIISGHHGVKATHSGREPMILQPITTGLATGPTREFALLNGALEILERDAFMITWLNQLTPPRVDIEALMKTNEALTQLMQKCARYRLTVSAVIMPTDAPAHAVCAVVRDDSGERPNVTIGLKAHRSLAAAVTGACLEALRIRQTVRFRDRNTPLDPKKPGQHIIHLERAQYWGAPGSADKLAFLTKGPIAEVATAPWESDTIEEHWQRILDWCRVEGYECASVDVGRSPHNVSPWKIEMVVMPDMQPMHQTEKLIYLGGERLTSIPKKFGYAPRSEPYAAEPHPFA